MQREISYRGRRADTKEWAYGYLFGIWERRYILWGTTNGIPNMIEVIPETVGQSTGPHDKNGKEIYEGDILHHIWDSGSGIKETISEVKFSDGAFVCDDNKRADFDLSVHALGVYAEIEVIGNIYENPELLNQPSNDEA